MKHNPSQEDLEKKIKSLERQIHGLKNALQVQQSGKNQYRAFFENSMDACFITMPDGRVLEANPMACKIFGYTQEEFIRLGRKAIVDPEDKQIQAAIKEREQKGKYKGELLFNRKDGTRIPMEITSVVFKDKNNLLTGMIIRDLTERTKMEADLQKSEEKYHTLFREMLNGFAFHEIIRDDQGRPINYRFLDVNPAFERITKLKADDILGKTVLDILPEVDPSWIEAYGRVTLTGVPEFFEHHSKRLNKYFEVTAFRHSPTQFACIFTDITERKRAEQGEKKLQEQLIQAQKMESVGRLAGGVAHDFNNMLAIILSYTQMLMDTTDPSDKNYNDLEQILTAAKRSADITRQLLAFARKQTINPRILDLNETVEGIIKMLRRIIGEDINLSWNPKANLWPIMADPSQVDQILANLCVNARDAITGIGKLTIETNTMTFDKAYCADHTGFVPGDFVLLAVGDDGCGMDKKTMAHIFDPFFTTKAIGQGTGLGLSTVYGIVKQNNGFINVYSEPGKGTVFKVYLPRRATDAKDLRPEMVSKALPAQGETILIVEDEPEFLKLGKRILRELGYTVLAASGAGQALALAQTHTGKIHLLLTDVIMPEMGGRDLADQLQTLYPDLKILFMSGYTSNVIAHRGVLDAGVHFIQKPFSNQDLAVKIREVLTLPAC